MLATYAASRHRQIVPCCMISSVSHDNVSRLVTDRSMCFATALDKAFENIDCMSAILRCQAKNRFYESTQRLIQPRRVLCPHAKGSLRARRQARNPQSAGLSSAQWDGCGHCLQSRWLGGQPMDGLCRVPQTAAPYVVAGVVQFDAITMGPEARRFSSD